MSNARDEREPNWDLLPYEAEEFFGLDEGEASGHMSGLRQRKRYRM